MIEENLLEIKKTMIEAVARRTRAPKDEPVKLIAVTKNHNAEVVKEALQTGVKYIGENRVQEAVKKFSELEDYEVEKHLIGHLQTNKVNQAVKNFDFIQSADSLHLITAINTAAKKINKIQNIFLQVNLAKEGAKFGIYEENLASIAEETLKLDNVKLRGFMLIAPDYADKEECRPLFSRMYDLYQQYKKEIGTNFSYLSMGMTHDYKIAIEEGANMVRIGTGIFGERKA